MGESKRRYDIDWLRVLAVLALIPFHTARIFDIWEPFYAKNDQTSEALTYIFVGGINSWHMPLFFLLAGASTWFALSFRSGGQYVKERFKRLIVPLVFGVLVIVVPQSYLGALTYGEFEGSFFWYYPRFFRIGATGDLTGYKGGFTLGHLWFILFLFLISLIVLPLLIYLRRKSGQRLIDRLVAFFSRPGMIFLPAIPLGLTLALPDIGGKNIFYDLVLFVYGYVLMADARFWDMLDRYKLPTLIFGVGLVVIIIGVVASGVKVTGIVGALLDFGYKGVATWPLLIAFLGFGRKYLNFSNKALKYTSEAAYPFYILHQTVIVLIGYYVVQWEVSVWSKFLVINVVAAAATLIAYEVLVKRVNVMRFLFGMKAKVRSRKVACVEPARS